MRSLDFSSWQGLLSTLTALALITLIGVGIRLVVMQTIQQRRERANRQINERLRVLIAAYKVLGGSFTGSLTVDPTHRRDLRRAAEAAGIDPPAATPLFERNRQVRDAVEAALSDIVLLGTEQQVRLASPAARSRPARSSPRSATSSARPSTSIRSRATSGSPPRGRRARQRAADGPAAKGEAKAAAAVAAAEEEAAVPQRAGAARRSASASRERAARTIPRRTAGPEPMRRGGQSPSFRRARTSGS